MAKPRRPKRKRKQRSEARDRIPPEVIAALPAVLSKDPSEASEQEIQLAMLQITLQRAIEIRLAQWIHAALETLRDEFGFNQEQLAQFARSFREKTSGQATKAAPEGKTD